MSDNNTLALLAQAIYTEALRLAAAGFKVIPVYGITAEGVCSCFRGTDCPSPGKHPKQDKWLDRATSDPDVIAAWPWDEPLNLGLVPGEALVVLDFDGEKGRATLGGLMQWCPQLQTGNYALFQTGSGGFHLIGRGSAPDKVRLLQGLDIRGMRGQAVIPPSLHFSGNRYQVIVPLTAQVDRFPDAVLALANGGTPPPELQIPDIVTKDDLQNLSRKGKYKDAYKAVLNGEPFALPGQRDTILTSMMGMLAGKFPSADPQQVAQLFKASIEAMASAEGAPTLDDVVLKFQKFASTERAREFDTDEILISVQIPDMARQGVEALARIKPPSLFRRGGQVSIVTHNRRLPDLSTRIEEPPKIQPASVTVVRGELSAVARWIKRNADGALVPKLPPTEVATYICDVGEWDGIPYLEAVVAGAFLRADGTICLGGCYDEATGIYSTSRSEIEEAFPVRQALEELADVFVDFPFKEGHYSAILASILTGAGRFAFKGPSPMFLIDANVRGAGKTLAVTAASLITTPGGAVNATVGQDNEEDRKQITSHAMAGSQTLLVDNVSGLFGTPKLCEALTLHDGIWSDRVLGGNTTWSGPFRPLWFATGNNVRPRADMVRRVCYCRIESMYERPENRTGFRHPALVGYVVEHRERFFWAALSVLKAYFDAGCPVEGDLKPWGGYEGWSDLVRGAVAWCGYQDPYLSHNDLIFGDEDYIQGQIILEGVRFLEASKGGPIKCSDVVDVLYGFSSLASGSKEQFNDLREVLEALSPYRSDKLQAPGIGKIFHRYRERVFDGWVLRQCGVAGREWKVSRVELI